MLKKSIIFALVIAFLFLVIIPVQAKSVSDYFPSRVTEGGEFVTGTAENVVVNVVMWMMSIIGIIAVAFVIYGGIMYATSAGNEQQIEKAKKILLYAIIGLVIAILALTITTFATRVVRGGEWCMVCEKWDPELNRTIKISTPFETEDECDLARSEAWSRGETTCGCQQGPCPSP